MEASVHVRPQFSMVVNEIPRDVFYSLTFHPSVSGTWISNNFVLLPGDAWVPGNSASLEGATVTGSCQLVSLVLQWHPNYLEFCQIGRTNAKADALAAGEDWWSTANPSWFEGDQVTWATQASILNLDGLALIHA